MRRAGWLLVVIATACASLAAPPCARAEQAPVTDEARALELFELAAERFREGRFREAIDLLDEANRLKPSAILHYNKARAYEGLGDKESAITEYETYLEMNPTAADRGAVERRLATLRDEIAERKRLEREKQQAAARAKRQKETRTTNTEPLAPRRDPSPGPWIMAGVGAIGLGIGIYFGVRARDQEEAGNDPALSQQEALAFAADAEDSALVANVLFATAGSVLLAGVIWGAIDLWTTSSP